MCCFINQTRADNGLTVDWQKFFHLLTRLYSISHQNSFSCSKDLQCLVSIQCASFSQQKGYWTLKKWHFLCFVSAVLCCSVIYALLIFVKCLQHIIVCCVIFDLLLSLHKFRKQPLIENFLVFRQPLLPFSEQLSTRCHCCGRWVIINV